MTKIVIDTLGGDKGYTAMVKGASVALETFSELSVVLVGDACKLGEECKNLGMPKGRFEIIDAPEGITNYDSPAEAIFKKTDSSMLKGLRALSERDDLFGMISAGNTGVLLAGAMRYLSGKKRVRPAMAAVLPAQNGSFTCLVDTGATVDCTPDMLCHFAHLGTEFMKNTYAIESPKVGLLSNGAESSKGNKLVKETYPLLENDKSINFIGNIEGNNALSGACDVLVCDGFAGNQVLKVTEGTAARIITDIMKYAQSTGSMQVKMAGMHLMGIYDISSLGGGIILGVEKPVIKTRGSAGAEAVVSTARMLLNTAHNKALFDADRNKI